MNKKDAIRAMLDGKKVRHRNYSAEKYIHFVDGCFVTALDNLVDSNELPDGGLKIYEEFTYPMWFKSLYSGEVSKFISLHGIASENEVIIADYPHTVTKAWEQVPEPKTVTIEKWLIYSMDNPKIIYVWEGSVEYINYYVARNACGKLKLLDSYEVTL